MPLIRRDAMPSAQAEPRRPADVLRDGNVDQRWSAARALGVVDGGPSVADTAKTLAYALRTEADPRVREAIFTSLVSIGGRECVDAVIPCLRLDDPQLRGGALDALRAMIGAVRPVLPALLADPDPDVRLLTCDLARELSAGDATRLLCDVLAHETEPNVCAAAVDVLAEIGEAEALPFLQACAARFSEVNFLCFAVRITMQRIVAGRPAPHA
jgi:HEAT repeat protein